MSNKRSPGKKSKLSKKSKVSKLSKSKLSRGKSLKSPKKSTFPYQYSQTKSERNMSKVRNMYNTVNSMHAEYFDVISNQEIDEMKREYAQYKLNEI